MQPPKPGPPGLPELSDALSTLGEDLLLLSVRPGDGRIMTIQRINYGLMGSELVRLAALRRVDVDDRQITVLDQAPTGDEELDAALASIAAARRRLRPKSWVGHPRRAIRDAYLARLAATGSLRLERGFLGRTRWLGGTPERAQQTRARLDSIAESAGYVDTADAAFGGLAHAVHLDIFLYRGFGNRRLRMRLAEIAAGRWTRPAPEASSATSAVQATDAAARAAASASTSAATQAAMNAAIQAATAAAVEAAVQASTAAAVSAATNAATDAGGSAHGHH